MPFIFPDVEGMFYKNPNYLVEKLYAGVDDSLVCWCLGGAHCLAKFQACSAYS